MRDYKEQIKRYIAMEREVLEQLDVNSINEVMDQLEEARTNGKKIYICGNGGSAATASHFVCDFNKGVSYGQAVPYDFECLSDNVPMMTAVANDIGYDDVFAVPLRNKLKAGDVVVGISGSGNSENVVKALEYANSVGAETIGLVGYDGGKVKTIVGHCIHVDVNNMQITEDIHLILDHMMMSILSDPGSGGCH